MKFKFLNRNEFKNIEYFKYELVKYTAYYNHTRINRNKKS
ncbi:transposase (plasmid) [Bacillus anthracis]|uniref:Transposase, IS3 family n=1 Tax=Bacillus cereus (strain 03BB102) TaxID=572264 RepID=A0A125Y9Q1_BACC3|nr:transposase, IS3 family [Bacillus cereus 03BB102]ACP17777.1 transposase, IS3 family [Bacillus anthracis str. CDC 684]APT29265.1 transposase [Bacillus anthracis]